MLGAASSIYAAFAARRRQWYARDGSRVRRLRRPVVSVGNLRVGGSGKTPVVAHLAQLLAEAGERPSILSRGYARRAPADGVTIVSDGRRLLADLDRAGDEPLMLARLLPHVPVLVGSDRYLSGRLAEERLGATVHLLDDGFQHVALFRDLDLLLADAADLQDRVVPAGRLREHPSAARSADALLTGGSADEIAALTRALAVPLAFRLRREMGSIRWLATGAPVPWTAGAPVLAVAGIARPERFFDDLAAAGWRVAGTLRFPDHHHYRAADIERIARSADEAAALAIVTTAKDAVRLEAGGGRLPLAVAPLTVTIEPPFADWLIGRLRDAAVSRHAGLVPPRTDHR